MLRRRFKILLKILLLLFASLFVLLLFERWRGQISLAHFKRQLAARGETLDVQKLIAPPVADADNGAPGILRLKERLKAGKVLPGSYPPKMKLIAPGKAIVGFRENSWVDENVTNTWEEIALDLATNQQTLDQLRFAIAKPTFDFRLDHSKGFDMNLLHLAPVKSLSLWFGLAVQNSLRNGENQTALEDLLAAVAIPRILENDRSMVISAIALKRYRLEKGREAPALASLVPEFLPSVPVDYILVNIRQTCSSDTFLAALLALLLRDDAGLGGSCDLCSRGDVSRNVSLARPRLFLERFDGAELRVRQHPCYFSIGMKMTIPAQPFDAVVLAALFLLAPAARGADGPPSPVVTFSSLLQQMTDREAAAQWPIPESAPSFLVMAASTVMAIVTNPKPPILTPAAMKPNPVPRSWETMSCL